MALVLHIDRAAGCRVELKSLLELWKSHGSHDILVAEDGGYRFGPAAEVVQANFFRIGMSRAKGLIDTPHGRRCALDCHPVGFNPHRDFDHQHVPGMREKFLVWGQFILFYGKSLGLVWGGRFSNMGKDGDLPHVELADWRRRFVFPTGEPVIVPDHESKDPRK